LSRGGAQAVARRLLDEPGYRQAARRLSAEIAMMPPPEEAVRDVEALVLTSSA
ncbi:MAG: hypothetical protein QOH73_2026, partial [Gaiellaceae bacterium]|nr:hypothetical protein [Gaiellaceae bacterium]